MAYGSCVSGPGPSSLRLPNTGGPYGRGPHILERPWLYTEPRALHTEVPGEAGREGLCSLCSVLPWQMSNTCLSQKKRALIGSIC